jgi:DNA polymerase III epsilon subunit-like protein
MAASVRSKKPKSRPDDLARRIGALTEGLVLDKILKADSQELVLEFTDGTRLLVRADARLDVSVT